MKFTRFTYHVPLIAFILSIGATVFAQGHGEGNGGGGVIKNGKVSTFYSAGIITDRSDEAAEQVPGLNKLVQVIYQMPYFTKAKAVELISALRPTPQRMYYRALPDHFDARVEARIREEYVRAMRIPNKNIALFAITDSNSKTTFLLPNFYKLKPTEQMAILFHEAYWIVKPNSQYAEVIAAEAKMQAFLESNNDPRKLLRLIDAIGTSVDYVKAAAGSDLKTGALRKLLDRNGNLPIATLLGRETIGCIRRDRVDFDCRAHFKFNLIDLSIKYPDSMLFPALSAQIDRNDQALAITTDALLYTRQDGWGTQSLLVWKHDEETSAGANPYMSCDVQGLKTGSFILKIDETQKAFVSPKPSRGWSGACANAQIIMYIEPSDIIGAGDDTFEGGPR